MTLPVKLHTEAFADLAELPSEALRREAFRFLVDLKTAPRLGLPLTDHPTLGDLSDCRKIYFDERRGLPPRFRIVYRLLPDETAPKSVDIIVIGARADEKVYLDALLRLGRGLS